MTVKYCITPEMTLKFKTPFGTLMIGSYIRTMKAFEKLIAESNPVMIVSVGDTVSRNLHKHGIVPKLSIVDNKSLRRKVKMQVFSAKTQIHVKNPQGTITEEAEQAVKQAIKMEGQFQIIVDGEEDLLTIIAVHYAPDNSMVVYGQPKEGIVVVKVNPEKKAETAQILKAMETVQKAK